MRLTTFGLLAAASMTLTSVSVWALAPVSAEPPASAPEPISAIPANASLAVAGLTKLLGAGEADPEAEPEFSAGNTLMLHGRLGHAVLAADRPDETFVFLEVEAPVELGTPAAPVNLSIVIDRSRSMHGKRLDNAMAAARGMIQRLRDGDTVSVVAYNTSTEVLVPPTFIDSRSRADVLFGLRNVEARGHTCISCGIETGMNLLAERRGAVNRMLLLSDGEANAGIRDLEGFRRLATRARDTDTAISSIGVDVDYNERVMFALAQSSNGRHYFVENATGLSRIFDDELQSLVQTVASGAEAEVDLAPGVQLVEVLDRAFRRDGNRLVVPFGAFSAGEKKTLLVRVRLPAGDPGRQPVADVRLRYSDLGTGRRGDCNGRLVALLTNRADDVHELDPLVEARVARAETAAAILRANEQFAAGEVEAATRTLADNRGRIRTRKASATTRARDEDQRSRVTDDFGRQLQVLERAEGGFAAAKSQPAPAASRPGKSAVRQNASAVNPFLQ
jgi:Ca-activated chloride channel homolog